MYIQITTRCNMSCEHCCNTCTPNGEDMSLSTFRKALEFDDEYVSLGGGEPTVHPKFWQFLGEALAIGNVWLATNGKKTQIALALAKIAKRGVISCALSQDNYHDTIDHEVVKAFTKKPRDGVGGYYETSDNDCREIRNVTGHEINSGRCDFGKDGCCCTDLLCTPSGEIKLCGCDDSPIVGNVNNVSFDLPMEFEYGVCWKDQNQEVFG